MQDAASLLSPVGDELITPTAELALTPEQRERLDAAPLHRREALAEALGLHARALRLHAGALTRFERLLRGTKARMDAAERAGVERPSTADRDRFAGRMRERLAHYQSATEAVEQAVAAVALASGKVPEAARAEARAAERALRPVAHGVLFNWLKAAPFVDRVYNKPLDIPGDFGMVLQIDGDPFAGDTLFGRLVNHFFVSAPVAQAHRNRIARLHDELNELAAEALEEGRQKRVLVIGCGPALDAQRFAREHARPEVLDFTFVDYSSAALLWVRGQLDAVATERGIGPSFRAIRDDARLIAEGRGRLLKALRAGDGQPFDRIVIAGLGDYLDDAVSAALIARCQELAAPGASLVFTNVHSINPDTFHMEHLLAWELIYRDRAAMTALAPAACGFDLDTDPTGLNLFLNVRFP